MINLPWVFKFHECERWAFPVFQINEGNFAEFVEQVLDVLCSYVRGQIPDVYPALIPAATTAARHFCELNKL